MLNGKEPKIVNGPEVLNKFVGASEENIRNLFADAEMDYKKMGEAPNGCWLLTAAASIGNDTSVWHGACSGPVHMSRHLRRPPAILL